MVVGEIVTDSISSPRKENEETKLDFEYDKFLKECRDLVDVSGCTENCEATDIILKMITSYKIKKHGL